jgi:hypothetical protein
VEFEPLAHDLRIAKMLSPADPGLHLLEREPIQLRKYLLFEFEHHDQKLPSCLRGRRPVRADRRLRADEKPSARNR